jgi:predicted neuraminidase
LHNDKPHNMAKSIAFWLAVAIAFGWAGLRCYAWHKTANFVVPPAVADSGNGAAPLYQMQFLPIPEDTPQVHSSTLTELPNGDILAAWYGGTREHGPDVGLYAATLDHATGRWGPWRLITERHQSQKEIGRYVKTVGNPVLFTDPHGTTWLFYATVSVGGWSGAAINFKTSTDGGRSWTEARRLVLSPLLNMVTMIRTPPLLYDDGTIALPAYHQGISKFPELVHLSASGEVLDKQRMDQARASLQPSIVATSPTDAIALLRNMAGGIKELTSSTAGETWSESARVDLPSPNSSLMAARLPDGRLLLAFNNSDHRTKLSLAASDDDGRHWKVVYEFPEEEGFFSYPALLATPGGTVHVTYTWNRVQIKHVMFNLAWLRSQS